MTMPSADGTIFLPQQASTAAVEVDAIFYFIYYLCVLFFLLLGGSAFYFLFKYRRREGGPEPVPISHNTALEIAWSVIPLILLVIIFAWGVKGFLNLSVAPRDAMEIHAYARRWLWEFEYPDGNKSVGELRVPVGRPVKIILLAQGDPAGNVIHSLFIPAFRVKADVLPNRYNTLWFEATRLGEFQIFCTEYCGAGHSDMLARVVVMEPEGFKKWLDSLNRPPEGMPLAKIGEELFGKFACVTCHKNRPDNAAVIGPSLLGAFGRREELADGSSVVIDENYLRESILQPAARVVKGYQPVMPPFQGTLKDWQVTALIEYIKTLK